jgi:simple sugar transport system ATP-binding protein
MTGATAPVGGPAARAGTTDASALELNGVSRRFGAVTALDDVSLRVSPGTVHAVLGENGAGKSTLCNIVYGALPPTSGSMRRVGEEYAPRSPAEALTRGVAMVHQHFSLLPNLSVRDNLLLGSWSRSARVRTLRAVDQVRDLYGVSIDLGATVGEMSLGARQQVEIAKALLRDPRLVLFDEPTAVLTPAEIDRFLATATALAGAGTAVVLVTHKLAEVRAVSDEFTVLRHGKVAGTGRVADLTTDAIIDLVMGRQASALDGVLAASLGLTAGDAAAGTAAEDPREAGAREIGTTPVLTVERLTLRDGGGALRLDGADLTVHAGEIVGVAGVEGNGQGELVAAISGSLPVTSGRITLGTDDITTEQPGVRNARGLAVIPEDRHHEAIIAEMGIGENLLLDRLDEFGRRRGIDRRAMDIEAERLMAAYDVRAAGPRAPLATLSGGNQQKVVLARELSRDPLLCVVAAEPTRGLDLGAVSAVVTRLRAAAARGIGVLVVSSELPELFALCDRIVVAYRGSLAGQVDVSSPGARDSVARLMMGEAS